jgi:ankyrin repeat protein
MHRARSSGSAICERSWRRHSCICPASDVPADDPWHAALHVTAGDGKLELTRKLLELGANPRLRDRHYDSTPLGWARHCGHQPLIDFLNRY